MKVTYNSAAQLYRAKPIAKFAAAEKSFAQEYAEIKTAAEAGHLRLQDQSPIVQKPQSGGYLAHLVTPQGTQFSLEKRTIPSTMYELTVGHHPRKQVWEAIEEDNLAAWLEASHDKQWAREQHQQEMDLLNLARLIDTKYVQPHLSA